jgi:hypothetical protein
MHANGKNETVETLPGMRRWRIKNDGEGEFNHDIFDIL